jgi:hypothetical protein
MKRSKHTNYTSADTQIYEYKNTYFVFEECQQGEELNPAHGSQQLASDFCDVSAKLPLNYDAKAMGEAVLQALEDFDRKPHPFGQFDFPARNKTISGWVGARGVGSLEKNCRVVQVIQALPLKTLVVKPFDNNNRNNWNGPMEDQVIELPATATARDVGEAVRKAFTRATYHPERKDSKV